MRLFGIAEYVGAMQDADNSSLPKLVAMAYPSHDWELERFRQPTLEPVVADSIEDHRQCFDFLSMQLGFSSLDKWYTLEKGRWRREQSPAWAKKIVSRYGNLIETLRVLYPEHKWHFWKLGIVPPVRPLLLIICCPRRFLIDV